MSEYQEDPIDTLHLKSMQLFAMLKTVVGEGFQTFQLKSDTIQENYLWACSDLADEIQRLALSGEVVGRSSKQ
jgi:hypothetical protein